MAHSQLTQFQMSQSLLSQSEREVQRQNVVALINEMPPGADPFEYVKMLKKNIIRNKIEEALMDDFMRKHLNLVKFNMRTLGHIGIDVESEDASEIPQSFSISFSSKLQLGKKKLCKSAPTTPIKVKGQAQSILPSANQAQGQNQNQVTTFNVSVTLEPGQSTSTVCTKGDFPSLSVEQLLRVESAFVHLNAAIGFANEILETEKADEEKCKRSKKSKIDWFEFAVPSTSHTITNATKSIGNSNGNLLPKPFLLIRALCKSIGDLMDVTSFNLDLKYMKMIFQAAKKANEIYELFYMRPEFKRLNFQDIGIDFLVEKCVNCLVHFENPEIDVGLASIERGDFVHGIFQEMKSLRIRHLMLEKLFGAMKKVLIRFRKSVDPAALSHIIDFADITGSFRILQLIEFILLTTSKERWLEKCALKSLQVMEEKVRESITFAQVLIFLSRQVNNAQRFVKDN